LDNGSALHQWIDYIRVRGQLITNGFNKFTDALENGVFSVEQIEIAYNATIFDQLAREIFREKPELARFSGHNHNALQKMFKKYDENLKILQCERIAWQVDQKKVPYGNSKGTVKSYTNCHLLKHECKKKRAHIPIRQLLKRAGVALQGLKPCFMMGPMSIAHFLEPGKIDFDLVVIDEASQVKPEDALGAVARADRLIVVGDPKQLPPTSFFDRVFHDDEEDQTGIEESESILDASLPIFPGRRLRWHYRSLQAEF